jgi:lipid-A-disaccharide synthase
MRQVMISCGEASGDLYAGALARALTRLSPDVEIFGLGGEHLQAAAGHLLGEYQGLAVTGLAEAVSVLPRSFAMYQRLVRAAREKRPDVFVAIDFPDFNFRLAKALRRLNIPVVYYISPQIWAWRPGRIKTLRRLVDHMLVIFPFEEALYREADIPVTYVGHPLVELARARQPRQELLTEHNLDPSAPTLALLPGSRPNEVAAILPVIMKATSLIAEQVPNLQALVARAPNLDSSLFDSHEAAKCPLRFIEGRTDDVLAASDVVVTASGTATIQAAIHGRPMIIVYRVSPLTYWLGKRFVHVDHYGMVNLVAGKSIVPELIQEQLTPEAVADEAVGMLTDPARNQLIRNALQHVNTQLGSGGASQRAAELVLAIASGKSSSVATSS